ncbi:MAG: hypothetical protein KBC57_07945 [Neisseriaceae bacterium]|nr:hypothetical protein [Neisseriaceae bacterium]
MLTFNKRIPRFHSLIYALGLWALISISSAQTRNSTGRALINPLPPIPAEYVEASRTAVTLDKRPAELIRYERRDRRNAGQGGEHFSMIINPQGQLQGFMRKTLTQTRGTLPTQAEARDLAIAFVTQYAPDLLSNYVFDATTMETEPLTIMGANGNNTRAAIQYVRVKMRHRDTKLWFFVFIDVNRQVMLFERDLAWDYMRFRRATEKWLFDDWRTRND